jgi:hypothetical protein
MKTPQRILRLIALPADGGDPLEALGVVGRAKLPGLPVGEAEIREQTSGPGRGEPDLIRGSFVGPTTHPIDVDELAGGSHDPGHLPERGGAGPSEPMEQVGEEKVVGRVAPHREPSWRGSADDQLR